MFNAVPKEYAKTVEWLNRRKNLIKDWDKSVMLDLKDIPHMLYGDVLDAAKKRMRFTLYRLSRGFPVSDEDMEDAIDTGLVSPVLKIMYADPAAWFKVFADFVLDDNGNVIEGHD